MYAPDAPKQHTLCRATMYRDRCWKLNVYHDNDYGELYDLRDDPDEFNNLWDDSAAQNIKYDLIKRNYYASIIITDPGPKRIGRF